MDAFIIVTKNKQLKGIASQYLFRVGKEIFLGNLSYRVASQLCAKLQALDPSASILWARSSSNEAGFTLENSNNDRLHDMEGIGLLLDPQRAK